MTYVFSRETDRTMLNPSQPVTDLESSDIICNTGVSHPSDVIQVSAGTQVTAHFHHLPTGYAGPDPTEPLDPTNKGPALAYL
jgi:cellulase